jgi:two-component system chemotaxis response regulator CheY
VTAPARALVIDDAATVRLFHGTILRRAAFLVDEAANGYEALEWALAVVYDLMLVDVNMPHLDGLTLIHRLRAAPHAVACPIITISNEDDRASGEAALRAGANLYLTKPVCTARLTALAGAFARDMSVRPAEWEGS